MGYADPLYIRSGAGIGVSGSGAHDPGNGTTGAHFTHMWDMWLVSGLVTLCGYYTLAITCHAVDAHLGIDTSIVRIFSQNDSNLI